MEAGQFVRGQWGAMLASILLSIFIMYSAAAGEDLARPLKASRDGVPLRLAEAEAVRDSGDADPSMKSVDWRAEYDRLQGRLADLQRQLEAAQQEVAGHKKAAADTGARVAALEKEKNQIAAALAEVRDQARDLATKLAAEQVKSATLREDKQRLMSGTTTTKDEVAKLQKRASEFETEAAKADDLTKRLAERDQDIERLRKALADRESLQNKMNALADKLDRASKRVTTLTDELTTVTEEAARARQERDQLLIELQRHGEGRAAPESGSTVLRPSAPGSLNNSSHDRTHLDIGPADERTPKRGPGANNAH